MLACHSVKIWLMLGEEAGNTWKTILMAQLPRYKSQQSISEDELDQKMFQKRVGYLSAVPVGRLLGLVRLPGRSWGRTLKMERAHAVKEAQAGQGAYPVNGPILVHSTSYG